MSGYGRDDYDSQQGGGYGGQQGGYGGQQGGGEYGGTIFNPNALNIAERQQAKNDAVRVDTTVVKRKGVTEAAIKVEAMEEAKMTTALADNREEVAMVVNNRMIMAPDASSSRAMEVRETTSKVHYTSRPKNRTLTRASYGGGGGYGGDDDLRGAAHHAQQHAGDSGDSNIFSNVISHLGQNKQNIGNQQINEQGTFSHTISRFDC